MTDSLRFISWKDIEQGEQLGLERRGNVYEGRWDGKNIAIKILQLQNPGRSQVTNLTTEARIISRMNSARVVKYYGICKVGRFSTSHHFALLMDLLLKGSLRELLKDSKQQLPWKAVRWKLAMDVGEGLSYLHGQGVIHGNLKSTNVLLSGDAFDIKIANFGWHAFRDLTKKTPWMAPELFSDKAQPTQASDLYAYGMVLWEIASRQVPLSDRKKGDLKQLVLSGKREDIPQDCPKAYAELIKQCWQEEAKDRPTVTDVLRALKEPRGEPSLKADTFMGGFGKSISKEELRVFKLLAKKGDSKAQYELGVCYDQGKGVEQDFKRAIHFYKLSGKQGYGPALYNVASAYFNGNGIESDIEQALKYYHRAAKAGDVPAQYVLAGIYYEGELVKKDQKQSAKYYRLAAAQGHALAQCCLGLAYELGEGAGVDMNKAVKYYQLSANQGYALAQYHLAQSYRLGRGVKKNISKALEYYKLAADQEDPSAQANLGLLYYRGDHVKQDFKLAVNYLTLAANKGIAQAQCVLGSCWENGRGVKKDLENAIEWYSRAADQGDLIAKKKLKKLGKFIRDELQKAINRSQKDSKQGGKNPKKELDS